MLTTKLIHNTSKFITFASETEVEFTGHDDFMVGQCVPGCPSRLIIGDEEADTYYVIGSIVWENPYPKAYYQTCIHHYGKDGVQKTRLSAIYINDRISSLDKWIGSKGKEELSTPLTAPLLSLLPTYSKGYIAFGAIEVESGDYIYLTAKHSNIDGANIDSGSFLQVTKLDA